MDTNNEPTQSWQEEYLQRPEMHPWINFYDMVIEWNRRIDEGADETTAMIDYLRSRWNSDTLESDNPY